MPQEIYGNADPSAQAAARASGGTATGVSEEDAAKWAAWRAAKNRESHGGPPAGPPPSPQETPSAYPSSTQFTEPNSAASVQDSTSGFTYDPKKRPGDAQSTAWNTPGAPQGTFFTPPTDPNAPAGAGAGTTVPNSGALNPTQLDAGQSEQIRGQQLDYLNALRDRMSGKAPSVADATFRLAQNDIARQSMGVAAQARGADAVAARRQTMLGIADQTQRAGLNAALVRAQESATAADQLGGALMGTRGQDIGVAGANAGLAADAGKTSFLEGGVNNRFNAGLTTGVRESAADRASREYIAKYQADKEQQNKLLGGGISAGTTFGSALLNYFLKQAQNPATAATGATALA